jgi:glycosyltransferase involved in cell wall biosynthesis
LGVKYVFDHHDINPELYLAKYNRKGFFYRCLLWAEKCTFKAAHYSIATNESYREIAIRRGNMPPAKVTIIRSGPQLERLTIKAGNRQYARGRQYLVGYVGVIGEQEGLDLLLASIQHIVQHRQDVQFAIVGSGTALPAIQALAREMELQAYVDFYGRVDDITLMDILNTAQVCVNPDRPTEMNNLSTMNKIMEYMALKKPVVQYDLKEGRYSAGAASLYAVNTDPCDFADKICWLLDHPAERLQMAEYGHHRIVHELCWDIESKKLVDLYKNILL